MLKTLKLPQPTWMCANEPEGGDPAGGTGDPSGGGGAAGGGGAPAGVPQSEVDRIVRGRVEETRKSTLAKLQEELGVDLDTAKQLIADSKKKQDDEKSDAQKAREQADQERAAAEREKQEAALDRHNSKVERALLRVAPTFEKDDDGKKLDAWVTRVSRLVNGEVEVGAEADAISDAVKALRDDMPELFGSAKKEGGEEPPPPGDPKGGPPKGGKSEDAFARGAERAKQVSAQSTYAILQEQT